MDQLVALLRASSSSSPEDGGRDVLARIALDHLDRLPVMGANLQPTPILSTPESSPHLPQVPSPPAPQLPQAAASRSLFPERRSLPSTSLNVSAFKAAAAAASAASTGRSGFRHDEDDGDDDGGGGSRKRFQPVPSFTTAKTRLLGASFSSNDSNNNNNGGGDEPGPKQFKPPLMRPSSSNNGNMRGSFNVKNSIQRHSQGPSPAPAVPPEEEVHPRLKGIDPELVQRIENDILESGETVTFDDIAGLDFAKQCIEEMVVWPMRNPELYTGLRQMPRGVLLFGPPGNGKTIIGKAIAHECNATFFSISASSLTSKWIGEGEKMVRALFAVAAVRQPSVVFIDEIDSLLTQRSAEENEASRRIKTEFLVQFDGTSTKQTDLVLIIGATNRPQELDEAARRRFVRRLYIPLPDHATRAKLLGHLLTKNDNTLTESEIAELGELTAGYSGADTTNLAREASMGPLRDVMRNKATNNNNNNNKQLRAITRKDFDVALRSVKASVSSKDLAEFERWNEEFGTQQLAQ
ncbi:hypothetical protein BASA81_001315 [Batrachochytrium salamandrivorans]|nr:hypothetical protein BASA81_001315 [Batrachochytrium salamandrivorans]